MARISNIIIALAMLMLVIVQGCSDEPRKAPQRQASSGGDIDHAQLARSSSSTETIGRIEPVAVFKGSMPTGVAVSRSGRIFVNYPRWGDPIDFSVAEVKNSKEIPYPSAEINNFQMGKESDHFIGVQSVVIDPQDRLWILDTATINMGPVISGGAKLIGVDLRSNQVFKRINFPPDVALSTTYLNDVRFDLKRGREGMAYITDSATRGSNGIIIVDLASGKSWRRLNDHPSTKADPNFTPTVEGRQLMQREPGKPEKPITMGSDGIAIDPSKGLLYYCPLGSRRLYSVSLDAISNPDTPDDQIAATVKQLPERDFASDGLEAAPDGTLYLTDYEHNAIRRLTPSGKYEIVASDPRMIWPDSMSISGNQLYFTANQLNRQAQYQNGKDLRQKPYVIFRTHIASRALAQSSH